MSFAKIVKEELAQLNRGSDEQLAELSALLLLNTELSILDGQQTLWFKSNNVTVARRFLLLAKKLYQVENTLLAKQVSSFKKNQQIQIGITKDLEHILSEHDIISNDKKTELITQTPETKQAFLRGAFLASGSVNDPKSSEYHLEIYTDHSNHVIFIQKLMNELSLNAKITTRRNGYIAYLKDVESIEDFLRHVGAQQTVFQFEDIRIKRDLNNSINRIMNCEIANEKKIAVAANEQIAHIEYIQKHIGLAIDFKMKQAIDIRLLYPELSLNELVSVFEETYKEKITKSGLNHRYLKIKQLAQQIANTKKES